MPLAPKPTSLLFGFSFLASASYVLMRAVAMGLFLARIGPAALPWAMVAGALCAIVVSFTSRALMRKRSTPRYATLSWLLLAVASGILAVVIGPHHHSIWALGALYVLAEIRSTLGTIYVVSLASETFAGADSKHPFAVVSSGAPIAGIITGLALGLEAPIAQAGVILGIVALLDALTAALTWWSRPRLARARASRAKSERRDEPVVSRSSFRSYRFDLSGLVALKILALALIAFQWKVAVAEHYGNNEVALVAYFAFFYAISDILIVGIQWLASGRFLDRFGLRAALLGFPLLAILVGIGVFLSPTEAALFVVLTLANGLNVLRRSVHDPALTAAYSLLHPEVRRETIFMVKGVIMPFAEAVAGVALILTGAVLMSRGVTLVWLAVVGLWLAFAWRVNRAYGEAAR